MVVEFRELLCDRVVECKRDAWAESTRKSYESFRKSYMTFCDKAGYTPVPVSIQQVCEYILYLSDRLAYASILKYLGIIRVMHEELGYKDPSVMADYAVKFVKSNHRRKSNK